MKKESQVTTENILKSRDDREPVRFSLLPNGEFKLCEGMECAWQKSEETFGKDILRQRIEPWLTALFQSEYLSLLAGSGLTHAIHGMAQDCGSPGMENANFRVFKSQINDAATRSARKAERDKSNIEDQIRVANELLIGLKHYCPISANFDGSDELRDKITTLNEDLLRVIHNFAVSILEGEKGIVSSSKREDAFKYLVNFLMSPASRTGTRDRLQIFTTNYDRLIEAGAEIAGMHLIDRFVGSLAPIFRSSRINVDMHYNPPGIRGEPRYLEGVTRFTKLHGSVDWVYSDRDIRRIGLPFGAESIDPYLNAPGINGSEALDLMIYPNAAKDRETASYPYVDLFRDFAAAVCRPNSTLVTYGYSFGDEHLNRVIEDMLTIPSTHLVIISYSDPMGRIMKTFNKAARKAQITLLIGATLGDLKTLVDHFLPKPAIDRTTFRMAELLKSRFGIEQGEKKDEKNQQGNKEA